MGSMELVLIAVGLAMDACAVSMTNGLREKNINIKKILFSKDFQDLRETPFVPAIHVIRGG